MPHAELRLAKSRSVMAGARSEDNQDQRIGCLLNVCSKLIFSQFCHMSRWSSIVVLTSSRCFVPSLPTRQKSARSHRMHSTTSLCEGSHRRRIWYSEQLARRPRAKDYLNSNRSFTTLSMLRIDISNASWAKAAWACFHPTYCSLLTRSFSLLSAKHFLGLVTFTCQGFRILGFRLKSFSV